MDGYLGETIVDIEQTEFKDYAQSDLVLYYIESYGQIDGDHHKQWVIDQITRILLGTKVIIKLAKWEDGYTEYRINIDEPPRKYLDWITVMRGEDIDGESEYGYDMGITP